LVVHTPDFMEFMTHFGDRHFTTLGTEMDGTTVGTMAFVTALVLEIIGDQITGDQIIMVQTLGGLLTGVDTTMDSITDSFMALGETVMRLMDIIMDLETL